MTIGYMNPAMAIITDLLFAQKGKVVDAEMILDIQFQMRKTSNLSPEMEKNIEESPVMRLTPKDLKRGAHLLVESGYTKRIKNPNAKSQKTLLLDRIKTMGPCVARRDLVSPMKEILTELGRKNNISNIQNALTVSIKALIAEGVLVYSDNEMTKTYTLTENKTQKDNDQ